MNTLRRTRPAVYDGLIVAVTLIAVLAFVLGLAIGVYAS